MIYRWVERHPGFTPYGPDFPTPEDAIEWGKEMVAQGNMTPEHYEIFMVKIDGNYSDIYKDDSGSPMTLGRLSW